LPEKSEKRAQASKRGVWQGRKITFESRQNFWGTNKGKNIKKSKNEVGKATISRTNKSWNSKTTNAGECMQAYTSRQGG